MKTNQAGIDLIKKFEGLRLHAYQDIVGVWTIGYGSTHPTPTPGQYISEDEADSLLSRDLATFERELTMLLTVPVTSNQFSALVSFCYNLGFGTLLKSSLLKALLNKDYLTAADVFPKYCMAGGVQIAGLLTRRLAEKALFLTPNTESPGDNSLDNVLQTLQTTA